MESTSGLRSHAPRLRARLTEGLLGPGVRHFLILAIGFGLTGSHDPVWAGSAEAAAQKLYLRACDHVRRGNLELAFSSLRESFGYGLLHPMQVVSDECFKPLVADSVWRPALRELLRRHAWEDSSVMVTPDEPGTRIELQVSVRDLVSGGPVSGATVKLIQADAQGQGSENPRLFAYLLTNDSGEIKVESIRPGSHVTAPGHSVPARVVVSITRTGYTTFTGEILLSADSLGVARNTQDKASVHALVAENLTFGAARPLFRAGIRLSPSP